MDAEIGRWGWAEPLLAGELFPILTIETAFFKI